MQSPSASPAVAPRPRWHRWLLIAAIVLAVLFALLQLVGAARELSRMFAHRQDSVAPWMTVGHVARLNHLAPQDLEVALGLEPGSSGRRPLGAIAREQHQPFGVFQLKVIAAIARLGGGPSPAASPRAAPTPPDRGP
jgi:hypothetical protein